MYVDSMVSKNLSDFFIEKTAGRRLSEVAKGTGIGDSFLSKLRSGKYKSAGLEVAIDLALYFNEPLDKILSLIGKDQYFDKLKRVLARDIDEPPIIAQVFQDHDTAKDFNQTEGRDDFIPIRIVDTVSLGQGRVISNEETKGYALIYKHALNRKAWSQPRISEKIICVWVDGDSMSPTIQNGSLAAIDIEDRAEIRNQKIYAVELPDEGVVLKRLHRTGDHLILFADNPATPDYPKCFRLDEELSPIRGRVVWTWNVLE